MTDVRARYVARIFGRNVRMHRRGTPRDRWGMVTYWLKPEDVATVPEAAAILGVTRRTAHRWLWLRSDFPKSRWLASLKVADLLRLRRRLRRERKGGSL
jgi:hypothetical protein